MINLKFTKGALIGSILAVSSVASAAQTQTFAGVIKVESPAALFSSDLTVFSTNGSVTASVDATQNGGCTLVSTEAQAQSHTAGSLSCYLEFDLTGTPLATTTDLTIIDVVAAVEAYPELTINYKIATFDKNGLKTYLTDWSPFNLSVAPVAGSSFTSAIFETQSGIKGFASIVEEFGDLASINVAVSSRDYEQKVAVFVDNVEQGFCNVAPGETDCIVNLSTLNLQGDNGTLDLKVDINGVFPGLALLEADTLATTNIPLAYDFSAPVNGSIDLSNLIANKTYTIAPDVTGLLPNQSYTVVVSNLPSGVHIVNSVNPGELDVSITKSVISRESFNFTITADDGRVFEGIGFVSPAPVDMIVNGFVPIVPSTTDAVLQTGFSDLMEPVRDQEGTLISGTKSLTIFSDASSLELTINGVTVPSGGSAPVMVNFIDGKPQLAVRAASRGLASLLFTFDDHSAQMFKGEVSMYALTGPEAISGQTEYTASFSEVSLELNTDCLVAASVDDLSTNGQNCFVDTSGSSPEIDALKTFQGLYSGVIATPGTYDLVANITTKLGNQVITTTHQKTVNVTAPNFTTAFGFSFGNTELNRGNALNVVSLVATPDTDYSCYPYVETEEQPTRVSSTYTLSRGTAYCKVVWTGIPEGLTVNTKRPLELSGTIANPLDKTVTYRIEVDTEDGVTHVVSEGSAELTLTHPAAPSIELSSPFSGINGEYMYFTNEEVVRIRGMAIGDGGLRAKLFDSLGTEVGDAFVTSKGVIRYLPAPTDRTVNQVSDYVLRVYYAGAPEVFAEKNIRIANVPSKKIVPFALEPSAGMTDLDSATFEVIAGVNKFDNGYDQATYGEWTIYMSKLDRNIPAGTTTVYEPVSTVTTLNDAGPVATVSVANPASGIQRFQVFGELKDQNSNTVAVRKGGIVSTVILKATDITGALASARNVVRTDSHNVFVFRPDVKSDYRHMTNVKWYIGQDNGSGVEYTLAEEKTGNRATTFVNVFNTPGIYFVKAEVVADGGSVYESEAVQTVVVDEFELSIPKVKYLMPGESKVVDFTINGDVPDSSIYSWRWMVGDVTSTAPNITIPAGSIGDKTKVLLKVWNTAAGEDERLAANNISHIYRVGHPTRLPVAFEGEKLVYENNGNTAYTVVADPKDPGFGLSLEGEWIKPDGTVIPGNTLSFAPTVDDLGVHTFKYRSWFAGHPDKVSESQYKMIVKTTKLPNFAVVDSRLPVMAPSIARLRLHPDRKLTTRELSSYVFDLNFDPDRFELIASKNGTVYGLVKQTGDTTLDITVTSPDGETKSYSNTYTVTEELLKSLRVNVYNVYNNKVKVYFIPSRMVSEDSVANIEITVDGTVVDPSLIEQAGSAYYIPFDPATTEHTISATITTAWGYSATGSVSFTSQ